MNNHEKFYITTPIYYVTAGPHVGSLYSTVIADVITRWQKLLGRDTFFLTGTDEHGHKVAQAAQNAHKDPQAFVDTVATQYRSMWDLYDLKYNDFIRTTEERHKKSVYHWFDVVLKKGDIYKGKYEGWYCLPEETFVAEKDITQSEQAPLCPSCGRPTIPLCEENYFFRLSAYQDRLLQFYKENPDFIVPKERLNEVISFVESGLKDLCISRKNLSWAFPFPGDPTFGIYVWVDALMNYATAVGYGNKDKEAEFEYWWPSDLHVMGKEIVKFHAAFWPAFLMAADLPLPKQLLVHGWLTVDGQKMSKSLGNVLDPKMLADQYGKEQIKYYLLRHIPVTQDGDFSFNGLEQSINSDLADSLGNLLNRLVALAEKNNLSVITAPSDWSQEAKELCVQADEMFFEYSTHMKTYLFHLALARLWKFINQVNAFFHSREPWKLAKTNPEQFMETLSATCHALRTISVMLWPIMPLKMNELQKSLGILFNENSGPMGGLILKEWDFEFKLTKIPALFQKIESKKEAPSQSTESKVQANQDSATISIETVAQVELVVGTIDDAQPIEKSDKLLKLNVNFGPRGHRTILAGIRAFYKPEDLVKTQAVFIYNLKPRALMGHESQGMLLIAQDDNGAHIVRPANQVANGTRLK